MIYSISLSRTAVTVQHWNPNPTNLRRILFKALHVQSWQEQAVNEPVRGFAYVCVRAMESVLLADLKVQNDVT